MEFLMTYGWALLVVLIAIGALAFFGVLNPSKFLPQQCVLGPGLACEDFKATAADKSIYINVRNGMGRNLDVFAIYVDKKQPTTGSEVCGGMAGNIALPFPLPDYQIFMDGSLRSLRSNKDANPLTGEVGLNCDLTVSGHVRENCCTSGSASSLIAITICGADPVTFLPNPCICQNMDCTRSTPLPTQVGDKFNQDIIIIYREKGSQILHQRVGRLTTQIE